jgi:hypothetical protein
MKLNILSNIDTSDLILDKEQIKELILELDGSRGEIDFTLDIIKSLISSLIEDDGMTKEEIIKEIF